MISIQNHWQKWSPSDFYKESFNELDLIKKCPQGVLPIFSRYLHKKQKNLVHDSGPLGPLVYYFALK